MRILRGRTRGFGNFTEEVDLPIASLPGPLVAVVGENGAGKSTLLELFGGAAYRSLKTRGTLNDLAVARDAYVEVHVEHVQRYTIRHTVDARTREGASLVLDADGRPALGSNVGAASRKAYDAWSLKALIPKEVYFASMFTPQSSYGILRLEESARAALLMRVLGVERIATMLASLRKLARTSAEQLSRVVGAIGELGATDVEAATRARDEARDIEAASIAAEQSATDAHAAAVAEAEVVRAAIAARDREAKVRDDAARAIADIDTRLGNNQRMLDDAANIRAAEVRLAAIDRQLWEADRVIEGARQREEKANQAVTSAYTTACQASDSVRAAEKAILTELQRVGALAIAIAAIAAIASEASLGSHEPLAYLRARIKAEDGTLAQIDADLCQLRAHRDETTNGRLVGLRAGLDGVLQSDTLERAHSTATIALGSDDDANDNGRVYASIETKEKERQIAARRVAQLNGWLSGVERQTAQVESLSDAPTKRDAAREHLKRLEEEAHSCAERNRLCREDHARIQAETETAKRAAVALRTERENVARVAALAPKLQAADARIAELTTQRAALSTQHEAAVVAVASIVGRASTPVPDVGAAAKRAGEAAGARRLAAARLATCEQTVTAIQGNAQRSQELLSSRVGWERDVSDHEHLEADLEAMRALEIDAAGPELTELTNDLLRNCHGPRWTVAVETQRAAKSDAKKVLEVCGVLVTDNEKGRTLQGDRLSFGEAVIVGEALSLALTILGCQRAGVSGPTLFRDETGAALSPANALAYVGMLRRAAAQLGTSHVLFVTHNPDVQALADCRVVIADGRLEIT